MPRRWQHVRRHDGSKGGGRKKRVQDGDANGSGILDKAVEAESSWRGPTLDSAREALPAGARAPRSPRPRLAPRCVHAARVPPEHGATAEHAPAIHASRARRRSVISGIVCVLLLSCMQPSVAEFRPQRSPWTTTRSAGGDDYFLAKEQSWRTAWRARSLLSWTSTGSAQLGRPNRSPGVGLRGEAGVRRARTASPRHGEGAHERPKRPPRRHQPRPVRRSAAPPRNTGAGRKG
jgi:hypothetical protein